LRPRRVSTIKYTLLMDFIQMGYDTLITDMDLVYMKNPFDHLHRPVGDMHALHCISIALRLHASPCPLSMPGTWAVDLALDLLFVRRLVTSCTGDCAAH
jgi:hypothetical protein